MDEHFRPLLNKKDDYGLDRDLQRRVNFTGIQGIPNQDAAVQESMGPIADRSLENLGSSDKAVIAYRKLILELARKLQGGEEPGAPSYGARYNIRSASLLLGKDVPFDKGAAALLAGSRRKSKSSPRA